ncbi:unnamed protein product [Ilex paraguariensis]|uniref:Uncharacterized protein n=1 Tax=Ilex paraguariensis TaxID=185542 RepID=A0ABC8SP80_9AQUA
MDKSLKCCTKLLENESNGNTTVMEVNPNGAATVVAGCSVPKGTWSNEVEPSNLVELMLENEMLRTMVETNRNFDQGVLNRRGLAAGRGNGRGPSQEGGRTGSNTSTWVARVMLEMAIGTELMQGC